MSLVTRKIITGNSESQTYNLESMMIKPERFFSTKRKSSIRVLTITSSFPSLIQPWLVNQLVGIVKNHNENRILARYKDSDVFSSDIKNYSLLNDSSHIPDSLIQLIFIQFRCFLSIKGLKVTLSGFIAALKLLGDAQLTLKERVFAFFLLPHLGNRSIDIIHSHSEMACNRFFPIIRALKKPLVMTFHGLPPVGVKPVTEQQRRRMAEIAEIVFVNTEFAKRQFVSLGGIENKIRILPQGIDLKQFPFSHRPYPMQSPINILSVGRFHKDKGQTYSISAISELIHQGFNIRYRLVGNGPDKINLVQQAEDLGIINNVEFYSKVPDEKLRELYSDSHIFILASVKSRDGFHEETQGVVLQEAQASGLITIATKVGGIPECIDDGVSGFLVDERSSQSIQNKLHDLIGNKEHWPEIQTKARQWVEDRYDINFICRKINDYYKELLDIR